MSFPSGRALTSVIISASSDVDGDGHQGTAADSADDIFVPHVFDFVSIAKNANVQTSSRVPSLFLGPLAVDHSTVIGNGASFSAFRRQIPDAPSLSFTTEAFHGLSVTVTPSREVRPKNVVYKVARVAFTDIGQPTPNTRQAMKAAMMELYALVHPPLRKHPNIIELLGLAWGFNYFDPAHRLPVLVVEHAEHGNLAQLQEKEDLQPSIRASLALDVGEGLKILHKCGIIHGDVKSENVLIFSHIEKKYIAKVADFGFSLVGEAADAEVFLGGTRPWKAPEAKRKIARHLLKSTDIYSYGLLLWRLATDGRDPFRFWTPSDLKGDAYLEAIESKKESDELVANTPLDKWFLSYLRQTQATEPVEPTLEWFGRLRPTLEHALQSQDDGFLDSPSAYTIISEFLRRALLLPISTEQVSSVAMAWAQRDLFYGRISSAMSQCVSADPLKRDLDSALECLTGRQSPSLSEAVPDSFQDILLETSYDHHSLSWPRMRDLEPAVQTFIFERFRCKAEQNASNRMINPPDCFILASYCINAYGTSLDYQEGSRLVLLASQKQYAHWPSRAYAYRICKALDANFIADEDMLSNLWDAAFFGSRLALEDLHTVAPEKYANVQPLLRDVMAGVGAHFFHPDQMLGGFTYWQWMNTFNDVDFLINNLGRRLESIADYKVNKRGDRILHLAAAAGKSEAIQALLDSFPALTVNGVNDQGETPLLCACRAGQIETVQRLLHLGGDASIATSAGESCLHWLVSFGDEDVRLIGSALLEAGAKIQQLTRSRISYSVFPATIDVDFQFPGSPLAWAVHNNRPFIVKFLIEQANNAMICLDWPTEILGPSSPMQMAAAYHHCDCLQLMVDAMQEAEIGFTYGPLIWAATHGADAFSMILRHGPMYKEMLKRTFDFLLDRSKKITFSTGIGSFGSSLLYLAVSGAHDCVVEYILSSHAEELLGPFDEVERVSYPGAYHPRDIDRAGGSDGFTPLLEAVRWNRKHIVELLLAHGADPKAAAKNPFTKGELSWTALHVLSNAGHNEDVSLASLLVEAGLPIDGKLEPFAARNPEYPEVLSPSHDTATEITEGIPCAETPLLVAIQNNAFNLANSLLGLGANPNAICFSCGLLTLAHPTTVLGHIIASSAQHTTSRLRYVLLNCPAREEINFIVTPALRLSAIHLAARANKGVRHRSSGEEDAKPVNRDEYDMFIIEEAMRELLVRWNEPTHLNLQSGVDGRTALHLAVDAINVGAVRLLVERGADVTLVDDFGLTPAELGQALLEGGEMNERDKDDMRSISFLLENAQSS